jgi:NTE family protein
MTTIKNLAFKGGGVLGIAYAGALQVLEQQQVLAGIERVAGTSAGAITAALISLDYSAADIKAIVTATSFKSFEDHFNPIEIPLQYGLYKGEALFNWVQNAVAKKGLSPNATFQDFKNHGCKDLHVFASDLNTQSVKEFCVDTTPNVVVAEAVRASMSIPLFFRAWSFTNNIPDNHLYVDGGMIYNFPITIFDSNGAPNPETLGLYLADLHGNQPVNDLGHDEFFKYAKILFETMLDAQNIDFMEDQEEKKRTIIIDNLGISATNFGITQAQEDALFASGVKYATEFLAK